MPKLADYKAPYPEPTANQRRYVIYLQEQPNEDDNFKVQLIPGQIKEVDPVNRHFIRAQVEEKTVQGWGYDYHVVTFGPAMGMTLMAPPPGAGTAPKFVGDYNQPLIRYNSKLPIVVYVPKEGVLHYKIWSAGKEGGAEGIAAKEE